MEKIELINMTLDEIRRAALMIEGVRNQAVFHDYIRPTDEVIMQTIADCTQQLERTRLSLRDVLEEITEFQNGTGMLCGVDCALAKVPFALIYERKTDKDFEN